MHIPRNRRDHGYIRERGASVIQQASEKQIKGQEKVKPFLFQIKSKHPDFETRDGRFESRWSWPPIFTGIQWAENSVQARAKIEGQYEKRLPGRVAKKDMASADFMMNISEVDQRYVDEFTGPKTCQQCSGTFTRFGLYNDGNETYKGSEFCGQSCKDKYTVEHSSNMFLNHAAGMGKYPSVIYEIRHKTTNMAYVGQTSQPFTLRWYQHFYHGGPCKFHKAIRESNITDWDFTILEVIDFKQKPEGMSNFHWIIHCEKSWINKKDTIAKGYNTTGSYKKNNEGQMEFFEEAS